MSHAFFFRLRESSNPRPKGHIEMGSTLTTNWASSSVGSESAPHFNMSLWFWVRALTEAKEKGMGHAPIACEWDHPSSEWARGWGPYNKRRLFFLLGPHPLAHSDEGWSHSQAIGACPLPFSFASVRARTQDQRDILKWGALSLPTGLLAQLVVETTSNGYLSSWSQVRAHGGERNPCELGG